MIVCSQSPVKQSKTQRNSVYSRVTHGKAATPHAEEAGTRECFGTFCSIITQKTLQNVEFAPLLGLDHET